MVVKWGSLVGDSDSYFFFIVIGCYSVFCKVSFFNLNHCFHFILFLAFLGVLFKCLFYFRRVVGIFACKILGLKLDL